MSQLLPVVALLLATCAADAQPVRKGPPIDLVAAPSFVPVVPSPGYRPPLWGGYWNGFFYTPYSPGVFPQPQVVVVSQSFVVAPPNPARLIEAADRAAALAPATITLELPAAADVWLDGVKQPSSADTTRTLVSSALPIGREFTFRVRAQWTESGTTYEATPTSTVRAGERGKLTVYAGTTVK